MIVSLENGIGILFFIEQTKKPQTQLLKLETQLLA